MSTTRWIIHRECDHGLNEDGRCLRWVDQRIPCDPPSDIIIDPDNLPPEAIQRAAAIIRECQEVMRQWMKGNETGSLDATVWALAIVRAFLSDPEPGDQT